MAKKRVVIEMQFDYDERSRIVDEVIDLQAKYLTRVCAERARSREQRTRSFLDTNEHDISIPFPSKNDPDRRARIVSWMSMDTELSDFGGEENFYNEILARFKLKKELEQKEHILDIEDIMETACSTEKDESACKSGIYMLNV